MKRTSRILAAAAALALSGTTVATATTFGQGSGPNSPTTTCSRSADCPRNTASSAPAAKLTAQQAYDIAYSREEERMARDLYKVFADTYNGARPFSNITKSEQRHFDAMGRLIDRYDLADPSAGKAAGEYAYPSLQKHYDAWLAQGMKSQVEANKAGADLERADIATLEAALKTDAPADVKNVYSNLLAGSRNHLAAFTRAASGQAVGQGQGRGRRDGTGQGQGQGQGRRDGTGQGQGARDGGKGVGKADGTGAGKRDGTGPRAGTQDCVRAS